MDKELKEFEEISDYIFNVSNITIKKPKED